MLSLGKCHSLRLCQNQETTSEVEVCLLVGSLEKLRTMNKEKKKKKNNAVIICHDRNQFWTTQKQFWQWVREGIVLKTGENPLTGQFSYEHQESIVVLSNTILNRAYPQHLQEALRARRLGRAGR